MTLIHETRIDHEGKPYKVILSKAHASNDEYRQWFAGQLREYLQRQECPTAHLPDAQLLAQTQNTFVHVHPA